jgi:hypothetical protein
VDAAAPHLGRDFGEPARPALLGRPLPNLPPPIDLKQLDLFTRRE